MAGQVRVALPLIKYVLRIKKIFLPGADGQLRVHGEVHGNGGGDPDAAQRRPGGRRHPGQAGVPQVVFCLKIDWRRHCYLSLSSLCLVWFGMFNILSLEFHREMKRTIGFVREQVENIKPFVETFKMARSFL